MASDSSNNSYAVLGATGNCGTALIQNLLERPNVKINAYCRNREKLYRLLPELIDDKRVQIYNGSIHDPAIIGDCIRGCKAVFMAVSTNDNTPGQALSEDTAHSVIAALQEIKGAEPQYAMPKLLLLSSATFDERLGRNIPWWFHPIMLRAGSNIYADLIRAEALLRSHSSWVTTIFIKPGGLSVDIKRGHTISLDEEESFVSYLDLAAGMMEIADDSEGQYEFKNVSVNNAGAAAKFPPGTPVTILMGLLRHYFPMLHPYLPTGGP